MPFWVAMSLAMAASAAKVAEPPLVFAPPVAPIGKNLTPPAANVFDWSGRYLTVRYGAAASVPPANACPVVERPANPGYCLRNDSGTYSCDPAGEPQPVASTGASLARSIAVGG